MSLFENEARQYKFDVLREVAKRSFKQDLDLEVCDELADLFISGKRGNERCCIYKEKQIIRERTKLALGLNAMSDSNYSKNQFVQVMEAACDGCSIQKIRITDNCRKCVTKSCLHSCRFDAITIGEHRAQIDYRKCKECSACVRSCSYNAIVESSRPCMQSCSINAISMDEYQIAKIAEEKCLNCGACMKACPFGAIEDRSMIVDVIKLLKSEQPVQAIVAPSIQGQYDNATLLQIMQALTQLGFETVVEAALGADVVAYCEQADFVEHFNKKEPMTTSCCPAFVKMAKVHYPKAYEKHVSHLVSPMVAMHRYLKQLNPNVKTVFIGPCIAKKEEALNYGLDAVLTFEELAALLCAKHIWPEQLSELAHIDASTIGRNFAIGGGVSKAVETLLSDEVLSRKPNIYFADGGHDCKKQLILLQANRQPNDLIEGMVCEGGCINGPARMSEVKKAKALMQQENKQGYNSDYLRMVEALSESLDLTFDK